MTARSTLRNRTKQLLAEDRLAIGMLVRLVSVPGIAHIAKASDHDFLFIDTQHAAIDPEAVGAIAQLAAACGVTPLVRVRSADDPDVSRLLDAGAMGIIAPDIGTAEQARRLVDACRFAPSGRRSLGGAPPGFGLEGAAPLDITETLNRETLVVCMIETREGVDNIEDIAGVAGVDVLHVGCNDLLLDMGRPGDFACAELEDAVDAVIAACRASGKVAGLGGDRDPERRRGYIEKGVRFVSSQSDAVMLLTEARRYGREIRAAAAPPR